MNVLRLFPLLLIFLSNTALSWNALGHQIIGQIAYDQLSRAKQLQLNQYNQAIDDVDFAKSAVWLDRQFGRNSFWLKPLHYVDFPYSTDNTRVENENESNALSAIEDSMKVLKDPSAFIDKKALHLRILIHVVGDIHQPLHAISRYSRRFPHGDKGGNLLILKSNPIAPNLHAYWDNGGGYLKPFKKTYRRKKTHRKKKSEFYSFYKEYLDRSNGKENDKYNDKDKDLAFKRRVKEIEELYPCTSLTINSDPKNWAKESWNLAINKAYKIHFHQKPNRAYQKIVSETTKEQIALAGCRLSSLLSGLH